MDFERKPLIGMVHLKPLPGSYLYDGDFEGVIEAALRDARTLEKAGFDAVMVENFGDVPFPKYADKTTVAAMAVAAKAIRDEVSLPLCKVSGRLTSNFGNNNEYGTEGSPNKTKYLPLE